MGGGLCMLSKRKMVIVVGVLLLLGGMEFYADHLLKRHAVLGNRSIQPYLMVGETYGKNHKEAFDKMWKQEGPEAYGYRRVGPVWGFPFEKADSPSRYQYLFQDRAVEAFESHPEQQRILVIGGSVAAGQGSSQLGRRWFVQVENRLSNTRLIPAAIGAYVTAQERIVFDTAIEIVKPQRVIFLHGFNDVAIPSSYLVRPGDPYNMGYLYQTYFSPLFGMERFLIDHTALMRLAFLKRLQISGDRVRREILDSPQRLKQFKEGVASEYFRNVEFLQRRCQKEGIACDFFLQPTRPLTSGKPLDDHERLIEVGYREIQSRVKVSSVQIVDLTNLIPSTDWYFDSCHFGDQGQAVVAEAIANHLNHSRHSRITLHEQ